MANRDRYGSKKYQKDLKRKKKAKEKMAKRQGKKEQATEVDKI